MFVALVSTSAQHPLTAETRRAVLSAVGAPKDDSILDWQSTHAHLACLPSRALDAYQGLWCDGRTEASALAGEPLIGDHGDCSRDHEAVVQDMRQDSSDALGRARGAFCGVYIREGAAGASITIFTDKLGIRPLYFARKDEWVCVASALPPVENLLGRGCSRDLLGMAENVAMGFAVGDRSHVSGIDVLRPAHVARIERNGRISRQYFAWDAIEPAGGDLRRAAHRAHELFLNAVDRRVRSDEVVISTLSGGLDSRCVVAALHQLGRRVVCLNRARPEAKDYVYARAIADALDCPFVALPMTDDSWFRRAFARYMADSDFAATWEVERPRTVWSGDGGSVGLGTVYLDEAAVRLARDGREREAVRHLLKSNLWTLPLGILKPHVARELEVALEDAVVHEVEGINCSDRGQALLIFLMLNDQHRHMEDVYRHENEWRLEYQMPFFDSDFLAHVFSVPLDERIRHRFYNCVLPHFPEPVRSVPWQVYPGHEGPEFPDDPDLLDQWRGGSGSPGLTERARTSRQMLGHALSIGGRSPLSRWRLALAGLIHLSGVRDYGYVLDAARRFALYSSDADG